MSYLEIELTAVDWRAEDRARYARSEAFTTVEDDLEQPMEHDFPPSLPSPENTFPVSIQVEAIREYYPRRPDEHTGTVRAGTRIVFQNGSARPVKETYDEVKAKIAAARGH